MKNIWLAQVLGWSIAKRHLGKPESRLAYTSLMLSFWIEVASSCCFYNKNSSSCSRAIITCTAKWPVLFDLRRGTYIFSGEELFSWIAIKLSIWCIDFWCSDILWLVRSSKFSPGVFGAEFPSAAGLCTRVEWTVSWHFSQSIWPCLKSQEGQYLLHLAITPANSYVHVYAALKY